MKILIYPKSINPYQELLYGPLRTIHPDDTFTYLAASPRNLVLFPLVIGAFRLRGYKVFHLHWYAFHLDRKYHIPASKFISLVYTLIVLSSLKLFGYKIIWTVHNVLPHEQQTSNDKFVAKYASRLSSTLIVHSSETTRQLRELGVDTFKVIVNPHGNYDGIYPINVDRGMARKLLSIAPSETAILFFGLIRSYKGVEDLVEAFSGLGLRNARLIIAGKCTDASIRRKIQTASRRASIEFHDRYIDDKDVATYFEAADIVCLPFKTVTTSGSALLALTFGKPLIAPRTGAIQDMPSGVGFLYDPRNAAELSNTLRSAVTQRAKLMSLGTNARRYAESLSWNNIGDKTYEIYESLLNQ